MRKPAEISINLIPKDPFFETAVGKLLKWALSIGRYIVIFTELVVIMSFVTRFSLDRQVTDLNDAINQKQVVIQSYGDLESTIRATQKKIEQYQQVSQQTNIAEIFPKLNNITPKDIKLTELNISATTISLQGTALSNDSLSLFINNLQLSSDFRNVVVDRIETGDQKDPGFQFRIRADIGREQIAPAQNSAAEEKVNILDRTQGL